MRTLSQISGNLTGQKMFQILAQAKKIEQSGHDVIHLEIGDPIFDSPPNVVDAACSALKDGHTHYAISAGMEEFREFAAKVTQKSRGFLPSIDQILVTPGANIQIYLAIACLVNPGEEVIISDPCFVSYTSIIELCGARAIKIPLHEKNEFKIDPDDLRKAVTPKTKLIIINSPHNPTGSVMNKEEMKEIYDIAELCDVYLLSDEVYGRMVYKDEHTNFCSPSVYDKCLERTILVHSFSKSYAMTGWRIGAVTGPEKVIKRMALLLETIVSCVPPFIQMAAIEAMSDDSKSYVDWMINEYRKRRDLIVSGLNDINGIECLNPGGAFYVFPNITGTGLTSEEFSRVILEKGKVASCPGNYFGEAGEGYARFCFANSESNILKALDRMNKTLS